VISCVVLMAMSWALVLIPGADRFLPQQKSVGVPVRDYIAQTGEFTICIFLLARIALDKWRMRQRLPAMGLLLLAGLFLINILDVATSRTALVVIPVLLLLFAVRYLPWKATAGLMVVAVVVGGL